jgi:hypothetical protein
MLGRVVVLFLLTGSGFVSIIPSLYHLIVRPIHGPRGRASFSTQISFRTDNLGQNYQFDRIV